MRTLARHTGGAVYVELLLVFLPVFLLFLAILQLGFVYAAKLVVQHAATRAARATVVIVDDDPDRYGDEARGRVDLGGQAGTPSPVEAFLGGIGLGGGPGDPGGGARFRDIHAAASIPLLAVAPTAAQLDDEKDSVDTSIGVGAERAATGARRYNRAALAITFPTEPGGDSFRTEFDRDDMVTVRVTYLFHCSVPLVPQLMCDSTAGVGGDLSAEEEAQLDLGFLAGLTNPRFLVLRGETTLPNQGAGFLYPSELP
jgi:TadE-like protein